MKQIFFTVLSMLISTLVMAQSPQAFNYQGVARDLDGSALSTKKIALRVSILKDAPSGDKVYTETHHKITTDQGLFSLQIGKGESTGSTLDVVKWGSGKHFLQVEMDVEGGNDFQLVGTSELLSVPYALYAENGSKWTKVANDLNYEGHGNLGIRISNTRNDNDSHSAVRFFHEGKEKAVVSSNNDKLLIRGIRPANDIAMQVHPDGRQIGNVGIGTLNPKSKLSVANGDVYIQDVDKGVIMKSPDGNCWRMTVENSGEPKFSKIWCPN